MTKIVVNMTELNKYSNQLLEDAQKFGSITSRMNGIIELLRKRGWSGFDADTFIKNSTTYLYDLRVVKEAIVESSQIVQRRKNKYTSRVEEYFDKIKFREEKHE